MVRAMVKSVVLQFLPNLRFPSLVFVRNQLIAASVKYGFKASLTISFLTALVIFGSLNIFGLSLLEALSERNCAIVFRNFPLSILRLWFSTLRVVFSLSLIFFSASSCFILSWSRLKFSLVNARGDVSEGPIFASAQGAMGVRTSVVGLHPKDKASFSQVQKLML